MSGALASGSGQEELAPFLDGVITLNDNRHGDSGRIHGAVVDFVGEAIPPHKVRVGGIGQVGRAAAERAIGGLSDDVPSVLRKTPR